MKTGSRQVGQYEVNYNSFSQFVHPSVNCCVSTGYALQALLTLIHWILHIHFHHHHLVPSSIQRLEIKNFHFSRSPAVLSMYTGCPKKIVPHLCGHCRGAVYSIISVFTQLHRSSFNLEFGTLYESIWQVVADLWQRKCKISGCFENSTSIVLQQSQNSL